MLSLVKNRVPRWRGSPQMEPKGSRLGVALLVMTRLGSESVCPPEFHIHKDITCVRMSWLQCSLSCQQQPWISEVPHGHGKGQRAALAPAGHSLPHFSAVPKSLFLPVVAAEMLSRKLFGGTFNNSNQRKTNYTPRPLELHFPERACNIIVLEVDKLWKVSAFSHCITYVQCLLGACPPTGKNIYFHVCKDAQNIAKLKPINILTSLLKMSGKKF